MKKLTNGMIDMLINSPTVSAEIGIFRNPPTLLQRSCCNKKTINYNAIRAALASLDQKQVNTVLKALSTNELAVVYEVGSKRVEIVLKTA